MARFHRKCQSLQVTVVNGRPFMLVWYHTHSRWTWIFSWKNQRMTLACLSKVDSQGTENTFYRDGQHVFGALSASCDIDRGNVSSRLHSLIRPSVPFAVSHLSAALAHGRVARLARAPRFVAEAANHLRSWDGRRKTVFGTRKTK